ncbi:MAG: polyprenol monophosphomannose synthase [Acidobacteriota bacterium]|nr:polyprenol monophosphomannose synthase [Acidobacteriota bacterium]
MPDLIVPLIDEAASTPQLALVIPTFNEAGNITPLLERVAAALGPAGITYEVIVVDDESSDATAERVRDVSARDAHVRLIIRKDERGLASAVVRGWQNSQAAVLGVMDADLQHPPELLPELWRAMQSGAGADLALASRYVPSASTKGWSLTRRLLSVVGIWTTGFVLPKERRVSDPASGFFLVRRQAIAGVPLAAQGFKLLLEILVLMKPVRGSIGRVVEVPFQFGVRQAGKSKGSAGVVVDYFVLLWKLRRVGAAASAGADSAADNNGPDARIK